MATALLREISQDERERAIFRSRRMYQTDMDSNMIGSERVGMAKVIDFLEKGGSLDDAKRMLCSGDYTAEKRVE